MREVFSVRRVWRVIILVVTVAGGVLLAGLISRNSFALIDDISCSHSNDPTIANQQFQEDQQFCESDYDYLCGDLLANSNVWTVTASAPDLAATISGVTPGCVYAQQLQITNDLSQPVTVSYAGYSDWGPDTVPTDCPVLGSNVRPPTAGCSIAPFIAGALDDWAPNEGITLQPGESTSIFNAYVGMPWFISNESINTTGAFQFSWQITPVDEPVTPPDPPKEIVPPVAESIPNPIVDMTSPNTGWFAK